MEAHDTVVFQFPFYWYSSPALLKEWFDITLQYGWAYGKDAYALVGNRAKIAVTTGGAEESYSREGYNGFSMDELLRPLHCTLKLCGMEWGEPFYVHNALHLDEADMDRLLSNYETWLLKDWTCRMNHFS